jgi:hypothetical protein
MHGNNTRKLPVELSSSQTSKNILFIFFFYKIGKQQSRTGPGTSGREEVQGKVVGG